MRPKRTDDKYWTGTRGFNHIQYESDLEDYIINLENENHPSYLGTVSGWVAVTDALPKALQTVWLTNSKGWCRLGCLVEDDEGWHWAESNGVIYIENGEIVSECESDDLDVNFWHELPKPPCH